MFNAKEYLSALARPTFVTEDGQTITGNIVKFNQAAEFTERLKAEKITREEMSQLVTDVCKVLDMLPAIPHILDLPLNGQAECLWDFFGFLIGRKASQ